MTGEPKQAASATMAIGYITVGALLTVWTTVFYFSQRDQPHSTNFNFWTTGFFTTGVILVGIGLFVGKIGREARQAEVAAAPSIQMVAPLTQPQAAPVVAASPTTAASPQTVQPARRVPIG